MAEKQTPQPDMRQHPWLVAEADGDIELLGLLVERERRIDALASPDSSPQYPDEPGRVGLFAIATEIKKAKAAHKDNPSP